MKLFLRPPYWHRKQRMHFGVRVAHFTRMPWVAVVTRVAADGLQTHAGCGSKPSSALNKLVADLRRKVWRQSEDEKRAPRRAPLHADAVGSDFFLGVFT